MAGWTVPRLWPGETVAVLATGPSLCQADVDRLHECGVPAIAVNDAFRLAPWASILFAMDDRWWRHKAVEVAGFAGIKVSLAFGPKIEGVEQMKTSGVTGFDPRRNRVRHGSNSGYGAVHIALHTGAARILLLGFDMHGGHFFGRHPSPLRNPTAAKFANWISLFGDLRGRGAEIVNCTPGSRLTAFPMSSLEVETGRLSVPLEVAA